ncbi:hypothetical protein MMC09_005527 [Bachmanniomyces sp. S44760]|nr:hypothetical protein [Bachmanniomyces sp. S44760]
MEESGETDPFAFADGELIYTEQDAKKARTSLSKELKKRIIRFMRNNDIVDRGGGDPHTRRRRNDFFTGLGLNDARKDENARKYFTDKIVKYMDVTAHRFKQGKVFVRHGDFIDWADWTMTWISDDWDGETQPPENWSRSLTFEELKLNLQKAVASLTYTSSELSQLINILMSGIGQVCLKHPSLPRNGQSLQLMDESDHQVDSTHRHLRGSLLAEDTSSVVDEKLESHNHVASDVPHTALADSPSSQPPPNNLRFIDPSILGLSGSGRNDVDNSGSINTVSMEKNNPSRGPEGISNLTQDSKLAGAQSDFITRTTDGNPAGAENDLSNGNNDGGPARTENDVHAGTPNVNVAGAGNDIPARSMDGDSAEAENPVTAGTTDMNAAGAGKEHTIGIEDGETAEAEDINSGHTKDDLLPEASGNISNPHAKPAKAIKTSRKRRGEEAKQLSKPRKSARRQT